MSVERTVLHGGRFYIYIKLAKGRKLTPRAHWVWLKTNPAFRDIPSGYVIHHLDNDQTNDDPSNLCLMLKTLHTAHHVKSIPHKVEVEVAVRDLPIIYLPRKMPRFKPCSHKGRDRETWYVYYMGYTEFGQRKQVRLYKNFQGATLHTEKQAQKLAEYIFSLTINSELVNDAQDAEQEQAAC